MSPRVRKSTSRRPSQAAEPEQQERRISPQERRRQILIHSGVWFLVLVFAMTSGIMCYNIGDQGQQGAADQAAQRQVDPVQAEIERWQTVVASNPGDPVALANLGYYYGQKARSLPTAAELAASSPAPGASPASPAPAAQPRETREQALSTAAEYLQNALEKDPGYAFALQQLAAVRAMEKDYAQARELLNRILQQAEGPVEEGEDATTIEADRRTRKAGAHIAMASLDFEQESIPAALGHLEKAIELQPGNAEAWLMKAAIQERQGHQDQALETLARAVSIGEQMQNPGAQLVGHLRRADILMARGDKDGARQELHKAEPVARQTRNFQAMVQVAQRLYDLDGTLPGAPAPGLPTGPASPAAGAPTAPAGSPASPAEATPAAGAPTAPAASSASPAEATPAAGAPTAPAGSPASPAEATPAAGAPAAPVGGEAAPE